MAQEIYTIKQLAKSAICPISKRQIVKLIQAGEFKKRGELRDGLNYILATNIGMGTQRMRWGVSREELDAWNERAKNNITKPLPGDDL